MWRKLTVDWLQAKIFCQKYFVDSWCQTVHPDGCLWKLFHLPAIIVDHYLFIFSGFFPWICVACGCVCSILQHSQVFWVYHSVWVSLQKLSMQDKFDTFFSVMQCQDWRWLSSAPIQTTAFMYLGQISFSWVRKYRINCCLENEFLI